MVRLLCSSKLPAQLGQAVSSSHPLRVGERLVILLFFSVLFIASGILSCRRPDPEQAFWRYTGSSHHGLVIPTPFSRLQTTVPMLSLFPRGCGQQSPVRFDVLVSSFVIDHGCSKDSSRRRSRCLTQS